MKKYIIKTVDGSRYETTDKLNYDTRFDLAWVYFPTNDGSGFVSINIHHIVCVVEKEIE